MGSRKPQTLPRIKPRPRRGYSPQQAENPHGGCVIQSQNPARRGRPLPRCPLWKNATQTVFGQGPPHAQAMLVGEQPGDKEDLAGKSFVGPAGQMLDRALEEASIDRKKVYVTNAVKHFKFVLRGKIRLHQKPTTPEIKACRQWYEREGDQTRSGGGNGCYISTKRVREDHAHQQKPWPPA
jgi:uracil-DNA glycosylase